MVAVAALALRCVGLGLVGLAVAAAMVPTGLPELAAREGLPRGLGAALKIRILNWNRRRTALTVGRWTSEPTASCL